MIRVRKQHGISILEFVILVAILVPLLLGIFVIGNFVLARASLDRLADRFASDSRFQPYKLITGDQGYFLYNKLHNDPKANNKQQKQLDDVIAELEKEVQQAIGCVGDACKQFYRVEYRWAQISINTETGRWSGTVCKRGLDSVDKINGEGGSRCGSNFFDDHNGPSGLYFRAAGNLSGTPFSSDQLVRAFEKLYTDIGEELPSRYAVPTALREVQQAQFHGFTEIRQNFRPGQQTLINYARGSLIVGVLIEVDLGEALLPDTLKSFHRFFSGADSKDPTYLYSNVAFMVPRQLF